MKRSQVISFLLTLIATLAGVFIAVWVNGKSARIKEKEDTVKLLSTAQVLVLNTKNITVALEQSIKQLEKDTITYDKEVIESIKGQNPIPYPELLESILTNQLLAKNLSPEAHAALFAELINLKKLANYQTVDHYVGTIDKLILLIDFESDYQNGLLSRSQLKNKYEEESDKINQQLQNENVKQMEIEIAN